MTIAIDYQAIHAAVVANRKKINECKQHRFELPTPPYPMGSKFRCLNCGGEIDGLQMFAYTQGFKAAGGDPNEIIPGYE